jgi:alkylation response protein AidB-like acyl-CoA dehydrogenase
MPERALSLAMISQSLPSWAHALVEDAAASAEDIEAALQLSEKHGMSFPLPGQGNTADRWAILAATAEANLTAARVLEAHADALAIIQEANDPVPEGTWGVFAAEAPPNRVECRADGSGVVLRGVKPWCSLAEYLDGALVTAHGPDGRQLFRVNLRHPSVQAHPAEQWLARGLRNVTSASVTFHDTPAQPVGGPEWYLFRPGFAWGGLGVAACWHGGAMGLYTALRRVTQARSGELGDMHVGRVDALLHASGSALADAARRVDSGEAQGDAGRILALRVRAVVAHAAERTLEQVGHALGPAPLAFDSDYAARVADLSLYVRQHHAERDEAALGAAIRELTDQR